LIRQRQLLLQRTHGHLEAGAGDLEPVCGSLPGPVFPAVQCDWCCGDCGSVHNGEGRAECFIRVNMPNMPLTDHTSVALVAR